MRGGHHSQTHRTPYPNAHHHNRGGSTGITGRAVNEEGHDKAQDEPGEVAKETGTTHADTMAKPLELIGRDRTDAINMPETGGRTSSHHATDGRPDETLDDDRRATFADATEMDPLDATRRTR